MPGQSTAQEGGSNAQADTGSTSSDAVKTITDQTATLKAQKELVDAQKSVIDAMYPSFGDKFGKTGETKIESGEGDKFHATAKSSEALRKAATKVSVAIENASTKKMIVMLTDDDRKAISAYSIAHMDLETIEARLKELQSPVPEGVTALALYGTGMLLSEAAEFTKLFRADRSLYFSSPNLPEQLLVDLVADGISKNQELLYPAASMDVTFSQERSTFMQQLKVLAEMRGRLPGDVVSKNKDLIDRYDKYVAALLTVDDTKYPLLFYVIRGEIATKAIKEAEGRILTVRLTNQAGTTMRVSRILRRDRLFASGGVIVSYRYTENDKVVAADVITVDSGLSEISISSN